MKKDIEKKKKILSQLSLQTNLDIEIWEACEGRKLSELELEELGYPLFEKRNGNGASLPAFGCSISHHSVYNEIVMQNYDDVLILEDDAILSPNLNEFVHSADKLLKLSKEPMAILLTPDFIYHKKDEKLIIDKYELVKVHGGYMATGYMINIEAAKLLSKSLFPIQYVADDWGAFMKMGLKVYGLIPYKVSFSGELGEIGQSIRNREESLLLKARHFLGRKKALLTNGMRYIKGYRRSK